MEFSAASCGKRLEIHRRHEARRVSACGKRAGERDGRLGVATRTKSKHGNIHGRMLPAFASFECEAEKRPYSDVFVAVLCSLRTLGRRT